MFLLSILQVRWHMPIISVLGRSSEEVTEFGANMCYIESSGITWLKKKNIQTYDKKILHVVFTINKLEEPFQ